MKCNLTYFSRRSEKSFQCSFRSFKLTIKELSCILKLCSPTYFTNYVFIFFHFYISRPSSVDALLFSCLAPLVKIPLSSGVMHNEVRKQQNLCQYVERILQRHFKEEKKKKEEPVSGPGEGAHFFCDCLLSLDIVPIINKKKQVNN